MKKMIAGLLLAAGFALTSSGCKSVDFSGARVEKKAEEYRRTGVASDMTEARQMAENFYWPGSARTKEEAARKEQAAALPKK